MRNAFLAYLLLSVSCLGQDWDFTVETKQVVKVETKKTESSKKYIAVFSTKYCSPCQQWKRVEKQKLKDLGIYVYEVDMSDPSISTKYSRRVSTVPTFVVCDYSTGEWVSEPLVGYRSAIELSERVIGKPVKVKTKVVVSLVYNGRNDGNSHSSRSSLIRHLISDGIHKGRHILQSLNSMSDEQLDSLHKQDHNW